MVSSVLQWKKTFLHIFTQSPKWGHWSLLCSGLTRQQADNKRGTVQNVQKGAEHHSLSGLILAVRIGFRYQGFCVWMELQIALVTTWFFHRNEQFVEIPVLFFILLSIPVIKYSGSHRREAACYFPQQNGSQWPLLSCYPWHGPVTAPWHCFRHGKSCWSWEDSLAPVYTTAGFVQKTWIS